MKKPILMVLLPSIFWLSPGIALAEVNVQTDNLRVRVGQQQGVTIEGPDAQNQDYNRQSSDPWGWFPLRNYWPFDEWFPKPNKKSMRCQTSHQETSRSNSNGVSYSSSSTEVCN